MAEALIVPVRDSTVFLEDHPREYAFRRLDLGVEDVSDAENEEQRVQLISEALPYINPKTIRGLGDVASFLEVHAPNQTRLLYVAEPIEGAASDALVALRVGDEESGAQQNLNQLDAQLLEKLKDKGEI